LIEYESTTIRSNCQLHTAGFFLNISRTCEQNEATQELCKTTAG